MFVDCSLNIEARVNPLVVAQIKPIVFHSRSLCAEYISVRHKSLGLPRKLHYLLFKTLEMTRLAPYLKCLRYSVKYWLLLKICLLVPRHINILYEWTTPSYAFNASKHARNNQIRGMSQSNQPHFSIVEMCF